jgi:beta-phosphoglucomutase
MLQTVIFDMDGVLVDSEPVIEAAAMRGLAEFGVTARPEDFAPFIGAGEDRYIGGVAEKHGLAYRVEMKRRVYEIYLEIVADMIEIYPATLASLARLRSAGWRLGLASSADLVKVRANLRAAGIAESTFGVLVTGEDVERKKPFPDIFLQAARALGAEPSGCVVVEDALNGVRAAKAAGMRCVAVSTSFTEAALREAGADDVAAEIGAAADWLLNEGFE